jgi:hypothetical protein
MPQSKILLGFLSAYHPSRWHRRQILLEQCLKNSPIPYKFVFGDEPYPGDRERCGIPDDVLLHAPGSDLKKYLHLKNYALFDYALSNDFDFCLRCCDDCWVYPERIAKAGLEIFDYAGHFPCKFKLGGTFSIPFRYMNYAHGGCGVWFSRKAMRMILDTEWDEHYLDSWPEKIDVGFGVQFPKPSWLWDDHFFGEVLQGNLAYDDPMREQPWEAYTANGISVFEDEMLFLNDEPQRPLTIHDPGVHKPNEHTMDELVEQLRKQNVTAAQTGQVSLPVRIEAGPLPVEEVSNAD